jgi:hypothetical protein
MFGSLRLAVKTGPFVLHNARHTSRQEAASDPTPQLTQPCLGAPVRSAKPKWNLRVDLRERIENAQQALFDET